MSEYLLKITYYPRDTRHLQLYSVPFVSVKGYNYNDIKSNL